MLILVAYLFCPESVYDLPTSLNPLKDHEMWFYLISSRMFLLSLFSLFSTTLVFFGFPSTRHVAVNSSYGGDSKCLGIQSRDSAKRSLQNSVWTCHSVGSYKRKPMTAATFSANGYVLLLWKLLSQYGIQRRLS